MGLGDLVLAQVLCVVGSAWVGVAAKLGRAHAAFWIGAIVLYYLPLAVVVIYLNRVLPLEGGLYEWAKQGFGEFLGFLTGWNLWVYAVLCVPTILFMVPTDISYLIGRGAEWLPGNRLVTATIVGGIIAGIALVAVYGLRVGKWLHNAGSGCILAAYGILLLLPLWPKLTERGIAYTPVPWQTPHANWFSLAVFGQMTVGALSGFEYVAIMAGECRGAARSIGRSVMISAPVIALMFILGTSTVLAFTGNEPINLIAPIPQTFRLAFGIKGLGALVARLAILLILARGIAAASLIFTGLTRLPMAAGWDHLLPAWFTTLHPRHRTPANSILFVAFLCLALVVLGMTGVREQEAMQLLQNASTVHYGLAYVGLFAIPIFGAGRIRKLLPCWLSAASCAGLVSSAIAVLIAIHPIIEVSSHTSYAAKIGGTVLISNMLGATIYRTRGTMGKAPETATA